MENLYKSLYDDIINDDNTNAHNFDLDIVNKISGQSDISSLSRYYSIEEYSAVAEPMGNNKYINISHINIRSIQKKLETLKSLLNCLPKPPDILAVTETWLKESNKHLYSLDGYVSHHLVRLNREQGGISVFIKNDFTTELLNQYCYINDDIEIFTFKLKTSNLTYTISVIYRPNSKHEKVNEFTSAINEILTNATFRSNKSILLGDFNINLLEHATHPPTNLFLNAFQALNYFPHISRPTRFPDNPDLGQPSLIDHIWTNFTPSSSSGIIHCGLSDHLLIFINLTQQFIPYTKHKISFRIHNTANHNSFTNELALVDWENLLCLPSTNDNFEVFLNIINRLYNKCYPLKTKFISTKRLQNPWITNGILNSIKHKCNLFKMHKLGTISHNYYKRYRNNLTQVIRLAKSNHYRQIFCNFRNNTKKIWQTINEIRNNKHVKNNVSTLQHNNLTLDNPSDIAEAFNNYFCNIAPELNSKLPKTNRNPVHYLKGNFPNSMLFPIITTQDTKDAIKTLKNKNSGINEVTVSVLKLNLDLVAQPLTILFNQSIATGTFPAKLKKAKVTPILKSGSNNDPKNFRPISNLVVFSKIFELLMKKHLMHYLENKNILNPTQFGFRRNHNTFQALNLFSSNIYSALDDSLSVLSIFIDFAKAFDTVNHKILLDKMYHYGIRGPIHSWFRDYLTDRNQITVFKGESSSSSSITLGVPQGSVLGPILFLIYINDISDIFTKSKTILFADDMTLYLNGPSPEQLIATANQELQQLHQWCLCNRLTINTDKTYYMLFTNKKTHNLPDLKINDCIIAKTNHLKFLGVTFDESMNFKFHINNLTLRISRHIALLYQIKDLMPPDVLKCIYYAHIYPLLTYCNPIWCTTYPTHLIPLQLQLKRIVRIITNSDFLAHSHPLFKQTQILKLDDVSKIAIATFMYVNKSNSLNLLPTHNYPTRHRDHLRPPTHRLTKFRHSVAFLGPVIWNTVPLHIQNSLSLNIFKNRLKTHILSTY